MGVKGRQKKLLSWQCQLVREFGPLVWDLGVAAGWVGPHPPPNPTPNPHVWWVMGTRPQGFFLLRRTNSQRTLTSKTNLDETIMQPRVPWVPTPSTLGTSPEYPRCAVLPLGGRGAGSSPSSLRG